MDFSVIWLSSWLIWKEMWIWLLWCGSVVGFHKESEWSVTVYEQQSDLEHFLFECNPGTDLQSVNFKTGQTICSESFILLLSAWPFFILQAILLMQ